MDLFDIENTLMDLVPDERPTMPTKTLKRPRESMADFVLSHLSRVLAKTGDHFSAPAIVHALAGQTLTHSGHQGGTPFSVTADELMHALAEHMGGGPAYGQILLMFRSDRVGTMTPRFRTVLMNAGFLPVTVKRARLTDLASAAERHLGVVFVGKY